jgi:hypothetical protein
MRSRSIAAFALAALTLTVGCGGGSDAPAAVAQKTASGTVPSDPIAKVVYEFFDAVRQGQMEAAKQRLTPLALQRITANKMNIAPPGSPTASFQVGQVTARQDNHALVSLTWSDVDADGKRYNEFIHCELRIDAGQWRICGMAQDLGPGRPPVVMDFESPQGIAASTAGKAAPTGTTAAAGAAATDATTAPKTVAQDPFQTQPVQR